MSPAIFALSKAVPTHAFKQRDIAQQIIDILSIQQEKNEFLLRVYQNSSIEKRYSVVSDFQHPRENWKFWGSQYPKTIPGMSERNLRYKQEAPALAERAAKLALERWGGEGARMTHIISVSCTGVIAPGIEYYLMQNLGLPSTINRIGINFMGCFGAFKGLSVARAFARENPEARILLVCTELCSLHLQADQDEDTIIANSLFSDGSAAAIIGSQAQSGEIPLWEIIQTHSLGFKNSLDKMSWEASDHGFLMRLSHTVPVHIKRHMQEFIRGLLIEGVQPEHCDWAIHPGGTSIVQAVEKALQLQPDQTQSSWRILSDYGNMSSATFLFVLDDLSYQTHLREWTAGVGFGPGLSAEGILLRRSPPQ
jgi:predicted naringenin-chalcone synthase